MKKFKSRSYCLVLYEEDETHRKAIEIIKQNYDYAMICHDKDIDEASGELKKVHYHIVLRFDNPKWNTALSSELGIEPNYIQESRSLKRSLLYLIHFYDENKYQYSVNCVEGPLKKRLEEFLQNEGKTESEKVLEILEEIDSIDFSIDIRVFVKKKKKKGYWDVFRRSTGIFIRYLDEHNHDYMEDARRK